jgi:hypothetical protein
MAEEELIANLGPRERTRQEVLWEIVSSEERYVAMQMWLDGLTDGKIRQRASQTCRDILQSALTPFSPIPISGPIQPSRYSDSYTFTTYAVAIPEPDFANGLE